MSINNRIDLTEPLLSTYKERVPLDWFSSCGNIFFLLPTSEILKAFKTSFFLHVPKDAEFIDRISSQSTLKISSFIFAKRLLFYENSFVAYLIDQVNGKDLDDKGHKLDEMIDPLDKLEKDVICYSKLGFILDDIWRKNIVFDGNYFIIDNDRNYLSKDSADAAIEKNLERLRMAFLYDLMFSRIVITAAQYKALFPDINKKNLKDAFQYLLNELKNRTNLEIQTIEEAKSAIKELVYYY